MHLIEHKLYQSDIERVCSLKLPWEKLQDRTVFISGACGMIGSFLTDVIMHRNQVYGMGCKIYAAGRDEKKARDRFRYCWESDDFHYIQCDINQPVQTGAGDKVDYVLHLASNTHPAAYSGDPVGTITANVVGTLNMLEFAAGHKAERFVFASSVEIYGENRRDTELFDEGYLGYIDCNTLRAGYPESKRCGEALCQAYRKKKGLDIVIPRFARTYGPTMLMSDTKAVSQFIKRGVEGENIVLKSKGEQYYSYTYAADAVSGLLTILLKGEDGAAYNVADNASDIRLKELAQLAAVNAGVKVIFELPEEEEAAGYSRSTVARMDGAKLKRLEWEAEYDIGRGIERTIKILRSIKS